MNLQTRPSIATYKRTISILNKFPGKQFRGLDSDGDDPSGENKETTQLRTDKGRTERKYHSSKTINSHQTQERKPR